MTFATPGSRYLTNHLFADGKHRGLTRVEVESDGAVSYYPFDGETHSTLWTDGVIIVIKADELTDFLLCDIEMMLSRGDSYDSINDYIAASDLYPRGDETAVALIF